jgi:hypothetical protein
MATYLSASRRRATATTVAAMQRSAERRRCPSCGRRSAIVRDPTNRMTYCRWAGERPARCDYVRLWDEGARVAQVDLVV